VVNVKLFTLLQNVVGGPCCIDLLTENRDKMATASNLAGEDDRSVTAVLAA